MADETVDLDSALAAFNAQVEAEQEAAHHWTAFDLAVECGVGYHQARAALEACQWSVTRARGKLWATHEQPQG